MDNSQQPTQPMPTQPLAPQPTPVTQTAPVSPQAVQTPVNQANSNPVPQKISPKAKNKSAFLKPVIMILIFLAALGGAGVLAYLVYQQIMTPPPVVDDSDDNGNGDEDDPLSTADWKAFENKEYGFKLKHPHLDETCCSIPGPASSSARTIHMLSDESTIEFPGTDEDFDGVTIFVDPNLADLEFDAYINQEIDLQKKQYKLATGTEFTTGGTVDLVTAGTQDEYSGKKVAGFTVDKNERYYFEFPDGKTILILSLSNEEKEQFAKVFDLMLFTLEFTRPEIKACSISQFQISFNVPETWSCETTVKNPGSFNEFVQTTVSSDFYTIIIDNPKDALPPCVSSGKDTQIGCFFNDFYIRTDYKLQMYQLNGEKLKIYGFLKHDRDYDDMYMTITYDGIEERGLTDEEKLPLFMFLDSLDI